MSELAVDRGLPTEAELPRALWWLALPVLAEQLLSFGVGFWDVYLSGRLGPVATSAIGLAAYVSWLASMIFGLIGMGTAALVARAWGAGDTAEARRITARSLFLAMMLGAVVCVFLRTAAPIFTDLLGMKAEARAIAIHYLRVDAFGQAFACTTLIASAALRGTGDMRTPLFVLGLTNLINIAVSTGCVYGWGPLPRMGVLGIATGTVTAQAVGSAVMLWAIFGRWSRLHVVLRDVRWDRDTTRRILRIGGPAAVDGAVTFAGHFLFLMVIARLSPQGFDGAVFAAHVVGVRVESLSYLPAVAWGIAGASLVGRLLGASQPAIALQTGHRAVRQFLAYALLMTFVFLIGAPWIYGTMHSDPAVAAIGTPALRLMAFYQIPNACLIIYLHCLRGAGDTSFPLWCNVISILGLRVPLAYLFGVVWEWGLMGAWLGMGIDNVVRAVLIGWRYSAGRWVHTRV